MKAPKVQRGTGMKKLKTKAIGKTKNFKTRELSPTVVGDLGGQTPLPSAGVPPRMTKKKADSIPLMGYSKSKSSVMSRLDT